MSDIRVGISGWTYPFWRGVFYPAGLVQRRELEYASRQVNSIEINGTFYSLQKPDSFAKWHDETPDDFVFAVKGGRYITHMKRLKEVETPLANFFASGLLRLGSKVGPILWQFPPNMRFDAERFADFLEMLPKDTKAAARLARKHDDRMADRNWTKAEGDAPLRHAFEIRHPSFCTEAFVDMLGEHNAALVVADTAGKWPLIEDVTADFMYLRLHGDIKLYESGYADEALARWADRIQKWSSGDEPDDAAKVSSRDAPKAKGRDVYVYFDNDIKVHAPFDAVDLADRLGLPSPEDGDLPDRRPER